MEGEPTALPLRDGAVDIVLTSLIDPDDASLPAVAASRPPPAIDTAAGHAAERAGPRRAGGHRGRD
ncbi:MAG: hypothetical protein LC744_04095, partial [Chloroflexi bacterium]|nr:hypothetical protein [Chloroflexota bacterium]